MRAIAFMTSSTNRSGGQPEGGLPIPVPRIIGIAGGSGSGKTTVARMAREILENELGHSCAVLAQDSYYIDQSAHFKGDGENVNFDHPSSLDFPLMATHLRALKQGQAVQVPIYDFVTHTRRPETQNLLPTDVVLVDGILILSQPEVVAALDDSYFISCPDQVRFERRLKRDTQERGRTREGVTKQFERQVRPMHDQFVEPSRKFAAHILDGTEPQDVLRSRLKALLSA